MCCRRSGAAAGAGGCYGHGFSGLQLALFNPSRSMDVPGTLTDPAVRRARCPRPRSDAGSAVISGKSFHPMDEKHETEGARVRAAVLQILGGGSAGLVGCGPFIFSKNEDVSDISTADLILLAVPFVNACHFLDADEKKVQELLKSFANDCVALGVVDVDCAALWRRVLCGTSDRADRVSVYRATRGFLLGTANWGDREWVLGLLRHVFFRCLGMFGVATKEARFLDSPRPSAPRAAHPARPPSVYRIGSCGHKIPIALGRGSAPAVPPGLLGRSDILRRGSGPTMTLDEYADIVVANMKKTENQRLETLADKEESPETPRSKLLLEDEVNDQKRCNLGNTRGMG